MNNLEVELRGPLDEAGHLALLDHLKKNGKHIISQKRLFFDLSREIGINNRSLDVRAKVTNGQVQIVVKKAAAAGSVSREETEINIEKGGLAQTLHTLALLGYPEGVYGEREIERYALGEVEFAIQKAMRVEGSGLHSIFYEAEIMANPEDKDQAEERLRQLLAELGLTVFDKNGWDAYEAILNKEANGWFNFTTTDISRFIKE